MTQIIQARDIDLRYLIDTFGLELVEDNLFFREWQEYLPEIADSDKQYLDKVKAGFINLLNYPPLLEDVVRMSVLDPILFLADFYLRPFYIKSEVSIDIITEDEGTIIKGKIDTLVLKDQLWIMLIESKRASYSVEAGLAQILAYMLGNPNLEKPSYGMITTGGTFVFIKLVQAEIPRYALSDIFEVRNQGNALYDVLKILKHLSQV
jgi:hypothetical protein